MKTIKTNLKYLKYLFWLGPMLLLAGATAGVVSGTWGAVPLGLMIVGMVVIGAWLLFLSYFEENHNQPGFWRRRSTQAGASAVLMTIAVLLILGVVNFLGTRYVGRVDLTENQVFTLAPETQQLVSGLPQPVKVWVFDPQQNTQDRELLESYRRRSKQFSYEFTNPNAQPTLVERLEVKRAGDVIVEVPATQRKQFVQSVGEQERLSEAKLTSAIAQVTGSQQPTAYFLQGHGEYLIEGGQTGFAQATQELKNRGFAIKPLNLVESQTLPKDANVIVVAGPKKSLLEAEATALNNYLKQGGNLLLMVDPNTNPGLNTMLSTWGVTLDNRLVIDVSERVAGLGPADVTVTQYGEHPITQDFYNQLSFYPVSRPVDVKEITGVQSTPLLLTSDRVWGESDFKGQPQFDPQSDRQGPLVLGFVLSRPVTPAPQPSPSPSPSPQASPTPNASPTPSPKVSPNPSPKSDTNQTTASKKESRLVVIGNSTFATDGYFNKVINGDVFLNSVRWLSQQDQQTLSIRPKETKNRRITLAGPQANLVAWMALIILPLLGFGAAAWVWWRRR